MIDRIQRSAEQERAALGRSPAISGPLHHEQERDPTAVLIALGSGRAYGTPSGRMSDCGFFERTCCRGMGAARPPAARASADGRCGDRTRLGIPDRLASESAFCLGKGGSSDAADGVFTDVEEARDLADLAPLVLHAPHFFPLRFVQRRRPAADASALAGGLEALAGAARQRDWPVRDTQILTLLQ